MVLCGRLLQRTDITDFPGPCVELRADCPLLGEWAPSQTRPAITAVNSGSGRLLRTNAPGPAIHLARSSSFPLTSAPTRYVARSALPSDNRPRAGTGAPGCARARRQRAGGAHGGGRRPMADAHTSCPTTGLPGPSVVGRGFRGRNRTGGVSDLIGGELAQPRSSLRTCGVLRTIP